MLLRVANRSVLLSCCFQYRTARFLLFGMVLFIVAVFSFFAERQCCGWQLTPSFKCKSLHGMLFSVFRRVSLVALKSCFIISHCVVMPEISVSVTSPWNSFDGSCKGYVIVLLSIHDCSVFRARACC